MDVLHYVSKLFENFIFLESEIFPGDLLDFGQKSLLCVYLETVYQYRSVRISSKTLDLRRVLISDQNRAVPQEENSIHDFFSKTSKIS